MKKIIFILAIILSQAALGKTLSVTPNTSITQISGYTEYNSGDIIIRVENIAPGCDNGFWIDGSSTGLNTVLSILLAAKHSGKNVTIFGDQDRIWPGSAGRFCHLYSVLE